MVESKSRTLFYRRVNWLDDKNRNMETLLKDAHREFNVTEERTFEYGDGEIEAMYVTSDTSGLFFHVASYVPDQPTSLVPVPSTDETKDTSEYPPPSEHNFMEGDIFFIVSNNHLVICPGGGTREAVVTSYIRNILRKIGHENILTKFSIDSVADIDKVRLLENEGAKKILLGSSLYEASMMNLERKTVRKTLLNKLAQNLVSLFMEDEDNNLKNIANRENLTVKLELSFDCRKKGFFVGQKRLNSLANDLVENEVEGFSVITSGGKTLKANEIRLSKKTKIESHGNSVLRNEAWLKLKEYLLELRESGAVEQ